MHSRQPHSTGPRPPEQRRGRTPSRLVGQPDLSAEPASPPIASWGPAPGVALSSFHPAPREGIRRGPESKRRPTRSPAVRRQAALVSSLDAIRVTIRLQEGWREGSAEALRAEVEALWAEVEAPRAGVGAPKVEVEAPRAEVGAPQVEAVDPGAGAGDPGEAEARRVASARAHPTDAHPRESPRQGREGRARRGPAGWGGS